MSHNTNQCCNYNKDTNPVATDTGEPFDSKKPYKKGGHKQLAYLTVPVESLVKKGLKKAANSKEPKCHNDSSSSDSDSE